MNSKCQLWMAALVALAGCSSSPPAANTRGGPETVLVTYHVLPGKELELRDALENAWKVYRHEHLVYASPHLILQASDAEGTQRIVEIFTWIKPPERPPENVIGAWQKEGSFCEPRGGHTAIEGAPVQLLPDK